MPKKPEKRIKAWAVITKEGEILFGVYDELVYKIFKNKSRAKRRGRFLKSDKVVPCQIILTPKTKKNG